MPEQVDETVDAGLDFSAYVAARGSALLRFAYLVAGDQSEAADLVHGSLRSTDRPGRLSAT